MDRTRKTKSLANIEERMRGVDEHSLRYRVLGSAKNFKTSWIELGQALYSVWNQKAYKEWGYHTFEAYTAKEIGIRKQTAMKLLRSYYFLEKEEPDLLRHDFMNSQDTALLPGYESIDILRLAKNKKSLDEGDYVNLKKEVFEKGKDARQLRQELTALIRQRQELEPQEARDKKRIATVKRFLNTLKSLEREIETLKLLPSPLLKEVAALIRKLEEEIA